MKKFFIVILILFTQVTSTQASKLDDILYDANFSQEIYPESRFQEITINNINSPLEYSGKDQQMANEIEKIVSPSSYEAFGSLLSETGLFNTFSMGNGVVDVTFQVKNGVNYALKENFRGYMEFERRKICEEILNANYNNHKLINKFLLKSALAKNSNEDVLFDFWDRFINKQKDSSISFLSLINNLMGLTENNNIFKIIQIFALGLLSLVIMSQIFLGFFEHGLVLEELVSKSVLRLVKYWLFIFLIPYFLELLVLICNLLHGCFIALANEINFDSNEYLEKLKKNWSDLANNTGYIPALVLSLADIVGQIYALIFIGGITLRLILGKIFSPIWALAYSIDGLKTRAQNSLSEWIKSALFLSSLPIFFVVFNQLYLELQIIDIPFIFISLDLAKFYLLPQFSELILGASSSNHINIYHGYREISSEMQDYIHEIKNIIYNQQLETRS